MNLMIVDNEPLEREVLTMIIKKENLQLGHIIEAKSGKDAIHLAAQEKIDLVLMDVEMPGLDGITAANFIKKDLPNCRFIFLATAYGKNDFVASAPDGKINEYLLKPAHPKEIIQTLTKYIPVQQRSLPSPLTAKIASLNKEILKVANYIENNLHLELKLDALAEMVHFNSQYLSRLFKQETTYTLTQYITACRIEKAKQYLCYFSDDTVVQISEKCGFVDSNYFARVFKKYEGLTPTEYQQQTYSNRKKRVNSFNNFVM